MDVPQFIAGRFRIEGEIGRGGMGTVYRATHLGLQRSVAVKIIKSEYAHDADVTERFMREARTMAKLRHAHAAMIFDAGNLPDGRHFIVMEFIEGVTLSAAISKEGQFSAERAVQIAIGVCEVLEEAHQLGIIHRDLKPANIMLNERGICVLDFGVAKVLASSADATSSQVSTGSGQIIGTPRYMSPEQCLGQKVGARSDLYSLGVVLYEMLAGRPPFVDPMPSVVLVKQATAPAPPLPRLRPDIPRSLSLAVHSLLAKRSEDRPNNAAAARVLLERSLVRPDRYDVPIEPLKSIVAAASYPRNLAVRIGAPLLLVSIMGALLLALGYAGPAAESAGADKNIAAEATQAAGLTSSPQTDVNKTNRPDSATAASTPRSRSATLSLEQAKNIVSTRSNAVMNDVVITQTTTGPAILAMQQDSSTGLANFLMMERKGQSFRVTDREALDTNNFKARSWNLEKVSIRDDGRNQILFSGISNPVRYPSIRVVLYDPFVRQGYSLVVETDGRTGKTRRMQWSENAADSKVAAYRVALRDKARLLITRGMRNL